MSSARQAEQESQPAYFTPFKARILHFFLSYLISFTLQSDFITVIVTRNLV